MYNKHIYNAMIQILPVVQSKWKYIDIVISSNLFSSELEELKSCIYRVETANVGTGLLWLWQHLLVLLLEETAFRKCLQIIIGDEIMQSLYDALLPYCWVRYL